MFKHFYRFPAVLTMCLCATSGVADQAPNPRSAVSADVNAVRNSSSRVVTRGDGSSATVVSRGAVKARNSGSVTARGATNKSTVARTGRDVTRHATVSNRSATTTVRSATKANPARSAVVGMKNNARSASKSVSNMGMARVANMARATAVFNDVSKIGGGYAQCRESYATCMDQFCANANDTFRRCYCSEKFTQFQETEAMFEEVKTLLQRFEDNNLNAVDKTAAEVKAMYTATVGEAAIKKDVSGAQSVLNEIGDLLSGKKKKTEEKKLNTLDFSSLTNGFSIDMDDLWGGGSVDSIFGGGSSRGGPNMTEMSGQQLYNESNKQCLEIIADSCSSNAILNMATSSYSLMITQDCNLYEKKLDTQRQAIMNTVREAEKMLRDARLEEYRAHNSADVNECISKVRSAMLQDTACGSDYNRCLDYSGQYISQTTGEAIYSPLLFKLTEMINLYSSGSDSFGDVLTNNTEFNKFLDSKKMFATTALDSCRDIADTVWTEFKRTAIIEIAQAQDEKIEEVKSTCVATMADCYDKESGGLKNLDTTSAQSAGAIAANAARAMCSDKVAACAALYGNGANCNFDDQGRVTNATQCGLSELLAYVATVDSTKIAEGCADAMAKYARETCAPASSDSSHQYPWGCRNITPMKLAENFDARAGIYCNVTNTDGTLNDTLIDPNTTVTRLVDTIYAEVGTMLADECDKFGGLWVDATCEEEPGATGAGSDWTKKVCNMGSAGSDGARTLNGATELKFYDAIGASADKIAESYGTCYQNSVQIQCEAQGGEEYAVYDAEKDQCIFTEKWHQERCAWIGGYYENNTCYYVQGE